MSRMTEKKESKTWGIERGKKKRKEERKWWANERGRVGRLVPDEYYPSRQLCMLLKPEDIYVLSVRLV